MDGKLRAHDSRTGEIRWTYDTVRAFTGTDGLTGRGGTINNAGVSIVDDMMYVNSGYLDGMPGNVLLAFGSR
jgi:polyvinyl alcohol dehydrogenase (cytochrome)